MYLTADSPEAFVDFPPVKPVPENKSICPGCKGHGGWNLRLNAYPKTPEDQKRYREQLRKYPVNGYDPDMSDEMFRHHYVHFRASCSHCSGWGYCDPSEANHVHVWGNETNVGNCLNNYTCEICGKVICVDSSD